MAWSHFYGDIQGAARTVATRQGTKASGLTAHLRSANTGIEVSLWHCNLSDCDVYDVWLTGGSLDPQRKTLLHRIRI